MVPITTVCVELLRHGPPHNQLLSPLTQYLARVGEKVETLHLPFEHHSFLLDLSQLRYTTDVEELRRNTIEKMGTEIGKILEQLIEFVPTGEQRFIHLELELSGSELAIIPFELSDMPGGGGGMRAPRLALQTRLPVAITRRVRGVGAPSAIWPVKPRVLFAWSESGGEVPHREHGGVLREAIKGWDDPWGDLATFKSLPDVTLESLEGEIATGQYTHVHLLAHGTESERRGTDYAIKLNDDEPVTGSRLTSAICRRGSRPGVVCLAVCDSGNLGSVHDRTGASVAHSLHQAGVPLVVASQFPLEVRGSTVMARVLYEGLFAVEDPRVVLHDIRTALHRHDERSHDWASVVAYASFPADLEEKLGESRYWLARRRDDQAAKAVRGATGPNAWKTWEDAIASYPTSGRYAAEGMGMRGSSYKRLAYAVFRSALKPRHAEKGREDMDRCIRYLELARGYYDDAARMFMTPREEDGLQNMASLHWVLTQQLGLLAVLGHDLSPATWWASWKNAEAHFERDQDDDRVWACASHAELAVLQLALPRNRRAAPPGGFQDWTGCALAYAVQMLTVEPQESWRISATAAAFSRYTNEWWMDPVFLDHLGSRQVKRPVDWNERQGLVPAVVRIIERLRPGSARPQRRKGPRKKSARKTAVRKKAAARRKPT